MLIKAVSRKGQNRIREGLGTEVVVLMHNHPTNSAAALVAPVSEPTMSSKFVRWIKITNDFEIIQ